MDVLDCLPSVNIADFNVAFYEDKYTLNLSSQGWIEVPEEIFEKLPHLHNFNASVNNIEYLSEKICQLVNLETLNLMDNHLVFLPENICCLKSVYLMNISNNYLRSIPNSIHLLSSLKQLNLSYNDLQDIPDELFLLPALEFLNLSDNKFQIFSSSVANARNLKCLILNNNFLVCLPDAIVALESIEELHLSNNNLTCLPKYFECIETLTYLDLSFNEFSFIPSQLYDCNSLTVLNLSNNLIDYVSIEIAKLSNLKSFFFGTNRLASIPWEIAYIKSLEWLDVSHNPMNFISRGILGNKNLISINFEAMKLKEIPSDVFENSNLQELNLSFLQLINKESQLEKLNCFPDIKVLKLNNMELNFFPDAVCSFKELQTLEMRDNCILRVPDQLSNLSESLTFLNISNNYFEEFPKSICYLINLKYLYINGNEIDSLPCEEPTGFFNLQNLRHFSAVWCKFKEFPLELCELRKLEVIDLSFNQELYIIPMEICQLKKLTSLNLSQTNFENFPEEVYDIKYLRSLSYDQAFGKKLTIFPTRLEELKRLNTLILSNNSIRELPDTISMIKQLGCLDLSHNQLLEIPSDICKCTNLHTLRLHDNKIKKLPSDFSLLSPHLLDLSLAKNNWTYKPPDVTCISGDIRPVECHLEKDFERDRMLMDRMLPLIAEKANANEWLRFLRKLKVPEKDLQEIKVQFKGRRLAKIRLEKGLEIWKTQGVCSPDELIYVAKWTNQENLYRTLREMKIFYDRITL